MLSNEGKGPGDRSLGLEAGNPTNGKPNQPATISHRIQSFGGFIIFIKHMQLIKYTYIVNFSPMITVPHRLSYTKISTLAQPIFSPMCMAHAS